MHWIKEYSDFRKTTTDLLRTVVRPATIAVITCGTLPTILQLVIRRAGRTINQNRRLKLDRSPNTKVLIHQLVQRGLLDVTSTRWEVEPVLTYVLAGIVAIFDTSQCHKRWNVTNAILVGDTSTVSNTIAGAIRCGILLGARSDVD